MPHTDKVKHWIIILERHRGISGAGITMRYKRIFERASLYRRLKGRVKKIRKLPLGDFTCGFISEMREDP